MIGLLLSVVFTVAMLCVSHKDLAGLDWLFDRYCVLLVGLLPWAAARGAYPLMLPAAFLFGLLAWAAPGNHQHRNAPGWLGPWLMAGVVLLALLGMPIDADSSDYLAFLLRSQS